MVLASGVLRKRPGEPGFPSAYFARPAEIAPLMESEGFATLDLICMIKERGWMRQDMVTHPQVPDLGAFEEFLKMCGIPPIGELLKQLIKEGGMPRCFTTL